MPAGRFRGELRLIDDEQPQIEVEPDLEGRVVVIVHGSLDLPEVGPLRAILTEICAGDAPGVVVDLTDVTFIGSSGLGILVQANNDLERLHRTLVIRGAATQIRQAFEITHLDQILAFDD
jgi:anti-sigma B factor antagonist